MEAFLGTDPKGDRLLFRPLLPDDAEDLGASVAKLSPRSRRMRFFGEPHALAPAQLRYLTELDYVNHFAWIAAVLNAPQREGVGIARWVRLRHGSTYAEAAIAVLDEWQRRGIGRTLLWLCARSAAERDINSFRLSVLGDNRPVLALLQRLGGHLGRWESGVLEAEFPLVDAGRFLDPGSAPIPLIRVIDRTKLARIYAQELCDETEHPPTATVQQEA